MSRIVDQIVSSFGKLVGSSIETDPGRAQRLLKLGYRVAYAYCRFRNYLPGERLLPNQVYSSLAINRMIRDPLDHPRDAAVVNIFFPCELLHAAGVKPQVAEGVAGYLNGTRCEHFFIDYAERAGIPKTLCSFHKTLLGAAFSRVLPRPRFVLFTTMVCDANLVTSKALADFWGVPLFTVDVPGSDGEEAAAYVEEQLRRAVEFLEDHTGKRFDYDRLREAIRRENRATRLYRAYLDEVATKNVPCDLTSEMYRLLFTHVLCGTEECEAYFRFLLEDARRAPAQGAGGRIRILWCHTVPYWQASVREIFAGGRYQLLCSDLNLDGLAELDERDPLRALAWKILRNPLRGPAERRARNILEMARYLHADGVVYFNHWGCKRTLGGALLTEEFLEESGIPVLVLDGDGCDRNNVNEGQMKTRLEAFLEILEARR